jgi:PKD repeat protein
MSQKFIYAIPLALLALVGGVLLPGSTGDDAGIYARIAGPQPPLEQAGTPMDVLSDFTNPPGTNWGVLFSENARGRDIIFTGDSYMVAGYGWDPAEDVFDRWALLARYDLNGNLLDSAVYDEEKANEAYSVIYDAALERYVVTGGKYHFYEEEGHEYEDYWVWLMSANSTLEKQWDEVYGTPFPDRGNSIIKDGDGYIIGGWEGISTLVHDGWGYMVRTQADGTLDWEVRANTDNTTSWLAPEIYSVARTSDGGAILGTESGMVKVSFASPPTFEWRSGEGEYFAAKQTSDGGYIGVGRKVVPSMWKPERDALLLTKLNAAGDVTWTYNYGNQRPIVGSTDIDDVGYDVIEVADGYVIAGETESWGYHGTGDLWVVKTDLSGIMEWDLVLGGESFDEGRAIVPAPGGGYIIAGSARWDDAYRIWTVKVPGGFTKPEASFTFDPPSPLFVEQPVDFDASASYDPDGSLVSYLWDFGDGNTGTGLMPRHTYRAPGTYITTLYVIDNDGVIDDYSLSITIKELEKQWEHYYGDARDWGHDIVATPDGGYVVAGINVLTTQGDVWAFKTDSRGNEVWNKTYAGIYGQVDAAFCVTIAQDGGYIVAGFRQKVVSPANRDIWILKLAEDTGDKVWEKFYDYGTGIEEAYDIQWDGDGYIITGQATADDPSRFYDILLLKIDINGNEVWHEKYPDPGGKHTCGYSVAPTFDGGYIITGGYADNYNCDGPFLTVKVKADRSVDWRINSSGATTKSTGYWVDQTADLGYIAAGNFESDFALIKYFPSGFVDWIKTWNPGYNDYVRGAASTVDGGYIIVGRKDLWTDEVVHLVKTDASGNMLWDWETEEGTPGEEGQSIITYSNGSCVVLFVRYDVVGSTGIFKLGPNIVPNASFDYSPDNPESGEWVTFDASNSFDEDGSIVTWEWDFGNGDTGSGETTFYTFPDYGTYDVTLTVVDDQGGVDIVTQTVDVAQGFIVNFYADPTMGEAPLAVDFYNSVVGGTPPYEYAWDLDNDGSVDDTDGYAEWTYTEQGAYSVSLEATDAVMQSKTETKTDYIIVYGVSAVTPGVTVEDWEITDDPTSDPETYDPADIPPDVDLENARGFCISASGPNGSYHFRITFTAPIGSDFALYKLPEWMEVPYTRIDNYTIDVELEIVGGVLDPPFVIAYRVPPVVAVDDAYNMDEDATLNVPVPGVLGNDIDVDGNTVAILVDDVSHGTLALSPDGSFTYSPQADYNGTDNFTYKANNDVADSNIATANITINPVNDPPNTPVNASPPNGATWISLTPDLEASAFSHPDNDIHIASRWQITTTPGDYSIPAFDSGTDSSNLTSIVIPGGILDYGTTYYWRVSYQDSRSVWSEWSEETRFLTEPETVLPGDANGDGSINVLDMTKVARIILQMDPPNPAADCNQDTSINVLDMTCIARKILGLD